VHGNEEKRLSGSKKKVIQEDPTSQQKAQNIQAKLSKW
jgi:hypothetical protein